MGERQAIRDSKQSREVFTVSRAYFSSPVRQIHPCNHETNTLNHEANAASRVTGLRCHQLLPFPILLSHLELQPITRPLCATQPFNMSQFFIRAEQHESFQEVEGYKGCWPRPWDPRRGDHPERNPPFEVPVATLREQGDIDETAIRGVLAAPASTIQ
jgi:hypothetical protein